MALEIASPGRALLGARGRAALSFQKLYLGVALAALTLAACDGPAPPMLRGPDGGVLTFDAAMIDVEPSDARAPPSASALPCASARPCARARPALTRVRARATARSPTCACACARAHA